MDLLAAVALMLVIEGMAIAIFAGSLPELIASIEGLGEAGRRWLGLALTVLGAVVYILVRG